jgi:hypothetical protein
MSQDDSWHDGLPPDQKARLLAEKTLQRLRQLCAQYPSEELEEAIRSLEAWREKHLHDT